MKHITLFIFVIVVLFGIVLSAETPQIVYIHYSTPEEAEAAQKRILAENKDATVLYAEDPRVKNFTTTTTTTTTSTTTTTTEKATKTTEKAGDLENQTTSQKTTVVAEDNDSKAIE